MHKPFTSTHGRALVAAVLFLLGFISADAQQFQVDWRRGGVQNITHPKHMALNPANGDRYIVTENSGGVQKISGTGVPVWSASYRMTLRAVGIAYKDGRVYVLCNEIPSMKIIMIQDRGASGTVHLPLLPRQTDPLFTSRSR